MLIGHVKAAARSTTSWRRAAFVALAVACASLPRMASGQEGFAQARLVENSVDVLGDQENWTLDRTPIMQVGGQASGLDLYRVRGAVRLASGVLVIANSGRNELLFLSPAGGLLKRVGREGSGPGEFMHMSSFGRLGHDSVYVWDHLNTRVSVFDRTGDLTESFSVGQFAFGAYGPHGTLSDKRFVFASSQARIGDGSFARDSTWVFIYDPSTETADTIARFPKSDLGNPAGSLIFGPQAVLTASGEHIVWGFGDVFELLRIDPFGGDHLRIRKAHEWFEIDGAKWARYVEYRVANLRGRSARLENMRARARRELENVHHAEHLPAFREVKLGTAGRLWVKEHSLPGVYNAPWHLFSPEGVWMGALRAPVGLSIMDVGPDWVLAVDRDDLDIEVLKLLTLRRGGSGGR